MSGNIDEHCIIVRNFPPSYTERDIHDFLRMFDASHVSVFVEHRTAVVEFGSKDHARDILTLLYQEAVDDRRLFVEYAPKNRSHIVALSSDAKYSDVKQSSNVTSDDENGFGIVDALKRLYATAENLNINQPPPPHLCYEYPKVNRDIIDAISIALESMPKFYIQVLHLMNRMNLEPPFIPGDKHLAYASTSAVQYATISTQTDELMWQQTIRSKRKLVESGESEMESQSSDDDNTDELNILRSKRSKLAPKNTPTDSNKQELLKQKQRNLLKMQRIQKQLESTDKPTTSQTTSIPVKIDEAFESPQMKVSSIKIIVPDQLDITPKESNPIKSMSMNDETIGFNNAHKPLEKTDSSESHLWTDSQIKENQIPPDQMKVHPMFLNYLPGEISNRLYIKNIAKEVTEADLRAIYDRYLEVNRNGQGNIRSIDIRLMTSGRMKGQAFITFDGPYLNCDYRMIEKALQETNGLILKGKPLVVVYGKKK